VRLARSLGESAKPRAGVLHCFFRLDSECIFEHGHVA
jgi:hypothetical protein